MHRVLFTIPTPFGPIHIASYGTMVALGALLGIFIATVRARRNGINPTIILDLALVVIISGLLGARLFFFVFDDWSALISRGKGLWTVLRQYINFPSGGLSFFGALAFGIPAGLIFLAKRLRREPGVGLWRVVDVCMPSIALGIAFARIGCYLNGCCYGKECSPSFPLAQVFPPGSYPAERYSHGLMDAASPPLYPTQLISSLNAFVLFVVLSLVFRRRKFDGMVFCIFGAWYGISRGLIEFLRADNKPNVFGVLTTWQFAGYLFALACIVLGLILARRSRRAASASA